jgi:hypothetical protein
MDRCREQGMDRRPLRQQQTHFYIFEPLQTAAPCAWPHANSLLCPTHALRCGCFFVLLLSLQIRVFCRVRPHPQSVVRCLAGGTGLSIALDSKDHPFTFDKVFGPNTQQQQVGPAGRGSAAL